MAVRPILFSAPMICALLDGRKTQTRRIVKQQKRLRMGKNVLRRGDRLPEYLNEYGSWQQWVPNAKTMRCPYGVRGDLLWVRETWRLTHVGGGRGGNIVPFNAYELERRADSSREYFEVEGDDDPHLKQASDKWRPSIFMPRWASRLTLEITGVRVQRLQDISEEDAIAEGYPTSCWAPDFKQVRHLENLPENRIPARLWYRVLWDQINGAGSWDANPWVVALTFAVHKMNVDALLAKRAAAMEDA